MDQMSKINGATLMARSLKQQGIDHLFGVVGFPVGPVAAAAQKEGINYVGMRNEQAASYAAQAYGYMTGRPGACITVTGPGVVHGLAGLANAQQNCWPMILIGGASETYRGGMGAFQEERQVHIGRTARGAIVGDTDCVGSGAGTLAACRGFSTPCSCRPRVAVQSG